MSTTTETGQERVRAVIREHIGTEFWTQHSLANALAAAGLLRGDDDLPAGLWERVIDVLNRFASTLGCADCRAARNNSEGMTCVPHQQLDALLRALTGAGVPPKPTQPRKCPHGIGTQCRDCNPQVGAPAKPLRRMQANMDPRELETPHGVEHDERPWCADAPPCQPVAEPAPVEDRPLVVGDVIDFIDEHGNEWTRSRRVEAWLAATPAPCRHPGAVAVETVYERLSSNFGGGWQRAFRDAAERERVTALFCPVPGCGARIEVKHGEA